MHVAHASGKVASTPTTAGEVDLLALVLGGAATNEGPGFPATLEAALAEGAPEDAVETAAASADGDPALGESEAALALAAALAASFAVESEPAAVTVEPVVEGVDGSPVDVATIDVATVEGMTVAGPRIEAVMVEAGAIVGANADAEVATTPSSAGASAEPAADTAVSAVGTAATRPRAEAGAVPPPESEAHAADEETAAPDEPTAKADTWAVAAPYAGDQARPIAPHALAGTTTSRHTSAIEASARAAVDGDTDAPEDAALDLGASEGRFAVVAAPSKNESVGNDTIAAAVIRGDEAARPSAGPASATEALPPLTGDGAQSDGIATKAAPTPAAEPPHASDALPRWSERVTDALRLSSARGGGEIRLQLEPEGLGHIDVRLHLHADGVRAVIVTEHESTRALLTSQQQVLEQAFARSDLRLSGFSVDVGSGHGSALPDSTPAPDGERDTPAHSTSTASEGGERSELAASPLPEGRVSVRV